MGHALKQIHKILAVNGRLIDMHPIGEPAPVTVHIGTEKHQAGWIKEEGEYEMYYLADEALEMAVSNSWYRQTANETFAFITIHGNLSKLQHYLETEWTAAYIEPLVAMQIESLMQSPISDQEITVKEVVRIACLEPILVDSKNI